MANLDKLKTDWEKADEKAGKLGGEYEGKRQKALSDLKERYTERLEKVTAEAVEAQRAYMDAMVLSALADRPDGRVVAEDLIAQGGLTREQVNEALGTED
jgi:uncharacterized protein YjbJ (UPF0337 family)